MKNQKQIDAKIGLAVRRTLTAALIIGMWAVTARLTLDLWNQAILGYMPGGFLWGLGGDSRLWTECTKNLFGQTTCPDSATINLIIMFMAVVVGGVLYEMSVKIVSGTLGNLLRRANKFVSKYQIRRKHKSGNEKCKYPKKRCSCPSQGDSK